MDGREIALGTLHRQDVPEPCINYCWMTNAGYMSRVAGRDYWQDREGVFAEYIRRCGINLVPQWYMPSEQHRRLEHHEHGVGEHWTLGHEINSPEDVVREIESLPDDAEVIRDFDIKQAAADYADTINRHMELLGPDVLVIAHFGQADFMGCYKRWGYENYLMAAGLYPEAMRRYYHHTALRGRLLNQAIARAVEDHGIAPFVYSGQDICTAKGPIMSPAMLRDLYFPQLQWAVEPLVEAGVGITWHCDGDIRPILDDIMALGVMGLQGFEEEHGPDFEELAKLTDPDGEPISIWGCVSVVTTLPHGTPADVRAAVERSFTAAGPGRGFILSSTSSIMPEVPDENIDALFDHGRTFGREYLGR
ncbi:MAG: uroporphyrinogen decarboxylase family protein [Armatimonadota bacterium]